MSAPKPSPDFMKYSSLGIQIMLIILLCFLFGWWLDKKASNSKPILTMVFALSGVVIALVYVVKETTKSKDKK